MKKDILVGIILSACIFLLFIIFLVTGVIALGPCPFGIISTEINFRKKIFP